MCVIITGPSIAEYHFVEYRYYMSAYFSSALREGNDRIYCLQEREVVRAADHLIFSSVDFF